MNLFIILFLLIVIFILLIIRFIRKDTYLNKNIYNRTNFNVIIGGCARDCEKNLPKVLEKIKKLSNNKNVYYIFYENDSKDNTLKLLNDFVNNNNVKGKIITEKLNIKRRTPRIAHCRNQILKHIFENDLHKKYNFFINMDLDDVNIDLNIESVNRCLQDFNNWDIASINQKKKYYDLWALRTEHKNNNCWRNEICTTNKLKKWFPYLNLNKRIPLDFKYISVKSAFGGLTIYKTHLLKNSYYTGEDINNKSIDDCEHVNFHKKIFENFPNTRFYIIPYMTNNGHHG